MPGNHVFPGGVVDETDKEFPYWSAHVDMEFQAIEESLAGDLDVRRVLAYAVAGIRETFEEAGALLALGKKTGENFQVCADLHRNQENFQKGWFLDLVGKEGWRLELSRLRRWAHWITPQQMKRVYDTRFFVAAMPMEQTCSPDSMETTKGIWISPQSGLEKNLNGEISLSPPTLVTLHQLSKFKDWRALQEKITHSPWGPPLRPKAVPLKHGAVIVEPWDPEYHEENISVDETSLRDKILPAGEDFSRLWHHDGIWRPIGA